MAPTPVPPPSTQAGGLRPGTQWVRGASSAPTGNFWVPPLEFSARHVAGIGGCNWQHPWGPMGDELRALGLLLGGVQPPLDVLWRWI